jgi:histidine triad (HIT) family protein
VVERQTLFIGGAFLAKEDFYPDCLFCRIAAGDIPSKIIYQDDDVLAFHDIQPQAKYHVLIIPRRHIASSLNDLEPEDDQVILKILRTARNIARELGIDESGYRLVVNTGHDAGQSVFHIHFHVLGGEPLGLFGSPKHTYNAG